MPTKESKSGFFSIKEVINMVKSNKIRDGKTMVGILLLFGGEMAAS